jgi:transcriptional regulator with XRE-family HTH domain
MELRQRFDMALQRSSSSSVADLARVLKISAPSIFEVLSGERPGRRLLPLIAEILGVHERWLRFGDDDVAPEWARMSPDLLAELKGLTDRVQKQMVQPKLPMRELLEAMLREQRAIRQALERIEKKSGSELSHECRYVAEVDKQAVSSTRSKPKT